ncbi:MAG: PEP-CTERM sorting domain-containing protein [Nostoc sp. LLA-1]|nr:PEP-CTERM sorting domain-containing protein [Cyanocohniella sp. LLY]
MVNINSLKAGVKKLAVVSSSAVLMTLSMNASAMAAIFYDLTDIIDDFAGRFEETYIATDINDDSQVVGYTYYHNRFRPGWLWNADKGRITIEDSSNPLNTYAILPTSINNAGQVALYRNTSDYGSWSGVWSKKNSLIYLETSFYFRSNAALGINNLGYVVGYTDFSSEPIYDEFGEFVSIDEFNYQAVLWNSNTGERISLGVLPGGERSYARVINDAGQVLGSSYSSGENGGFFDNRKDFVWHRQTGMVELSAIIGADNVFASDINHLGQILGYSLNGNERRDFLWRPGAGIMYLPENMLASKINEVGQVIGTCDGRPCLLRSTTELVDIISLIDPSLNWEIFGVTAINNKGQIIGQGYTKNEENYFDTVIRPFLLTHRTVSKTVPEPNTIGGILLAGMGITYLRRRQSQL